MIWNLPPRSDVEDYIGRLSADGTKLPDSFVYPPTDDDGELNQEADGSRDDSLADHDHDFHEEPVRKVGSSNMEFASADGSRFPDSVDPFDQFEQLLKAGDLAVGGENQRDW